MTKKTFFRASAIIFLLVGLTHLLRIVIGFDITIGSITFPRSVSWIEMIIAFYLSFQGFRLAKK